MFFFCLSTKLLKKLIKNKSINMKDIDSKIIYWALISRLLTQLQLFLLWSYQDIWRWYLPKKLKIFISIVMLYILFASKLWPYYHMHFEYFNWAKLSFGSFTLLPQIYQCQKVHNQGLNGLLHNLDQFESLSDTIWSLLMYYWSFWK